MAETNPKNEPKEVYPNDRLYDILNISKREKTIKFRNGSMYIARIGKTLILSTITGSFGGRTRMFRLMDKDIRIK